MSYLDKSDKRFNWIAVPAHSSVRREAGCVQCGSRLELDEFGKTNLTGKCLNCSSWVSDDDEVFEELDG